MWFGTVPALARKRGRVASGRSDIGELLLRSDSGKAEHGPLLVPAKRQTRVRQQFVCGQIARLASVKNGFGDVRGEIAKTNEPREIGRAHALPLGQCGKRHAIAVEECGIEPVRPDQQLDQPVLARTSLIASHLSRRLSRES